MNLNNSTYVTDDWKTREGKGAFENFYIVGLFIAASAILSTNTRVIYLYCSRHRTYLKTLPNRLLLSLGICDLLTGAAVMLSAVSHLYHITHLTYRILMDIFTTALVKAVIMHLCCITLDRYLAIFIALRYQELITKRVIHFLIGVSWIIPVITAIIPFAWLNDVLFFNKKDTSDIQKREIWYSIISFFVFVAIPMCLLGIAFFHMYIKVKKILQRTPGHRKTNISPKTLKLIYIFSAMYMVFLLLAMPYFLLRLWLDIIYWKKADSIISDAQMTVIRVSLLLKAGTSILNPLLYTHASVELNRMSNQGRRKSTLSHQLERCRKFSQEAFRKISSHQKRERKTHVNKREHESLTFSTLSEHTEETHC